ncbi:hypothetical protein [Vibrio phage BUCT194]|uniref:Primase C-terminal 1 domain-containing protein n=1 Tax=Vibrio phage BUCT194 TaxID=2859072 RepID=A0AAE8XJ88_9CAUD|nr:hypothetical protein PP741_gp085 [Vibrio phage BUCT194]UAW01140.1 hypothetical protein [Vibrio phage BUCT194]
MKPVDQLKHHPKVELLSDILSARIQSPNKDFAIIMSCYHLTKLASMMRTTVNAHGFGKLLVNFYGVNAAPSGYGKGHATKIIEEQVTHLFRQTFLDYTLPTVTEKSLVDLAVKRAQRKGTDDQEELELVKAEFKKLGVYLTSFDSGTSPALKQFRHQLLMSQIGSINFEVDEMGSHLLNNKEIIDVYLELYDGVVKPKLVKNTAESTRNEEIIGKTPTNMLMFGTPATLLDGGATEKAYTDMLTTGYARRCFFGYSVIEPTKKLSKAARLKMLTDTSSDAQLLQLAVDLERLADPVNHNFEVTVPTALMPEILEYQIHCEDIMDSFKSSDEIRRAEARGRYYKTLRLAGAFAFLDSSPDMTLAHWEAAVKVAELSANCFYDMLDIDPPHARLAKYLAECKEPMTHADLMEELPYFPKAVGAQRDLIKLAIAHGHKNNIIIKRTIQDDIDFIQGEALQTNDINNFNAIISWTDSTFPGISEGFNNQVCPWDKLDVLTTRPDAHWCSHHFLDGIRRTSHVIQGFNTIVIDVDGTTTIDQARTVLKDYAYHMYTTKRHDESAHRFRIVLPMSHTLKLSPDEYKEFMNNVLEFLPFDTDEQTSQANRKWLSNSNGIVFNNDGKLFDVLPYIPKTKKNEERKSFIDSSSSMDKLERFFYSQSEEGNRNNVLFKFGAALIDAGYQLDDLVLKVKTFNSKLPKPLSEDELNNTVLNSIQRKFYTKG